MTLQGAILPFFFLYLLFLPSPVSSAFPQSNWTAQTVQWGLCITNQKWRRSHQQPTCSKPLLTTRSLMLYRAELKVREWRSRVIDEKFLPFSRRQHQHEPLLHTKSPFIRYTKKSNSNTCTLGYTHAVAFSSIWRLYFYEFLWSLCSLSQTHAQVIA